jgi:hypothetical protein
MGFAFVGKLIFLSKKSIKTIEKNCAIVCGFKQGTTQNFQQEH